MFAKLFDTPHGQLLLTKEFEDEEYQLTARGQDFGGASPAVSFTFETQEARDAAFDTATQEQADATAAQLDSTVRSLMGHINDGAPE